MLLTHDTGPIVALDNMVRGRPANLERALASGRVTLIEGDIRDARLVDGLVAGSDVVFHQAALRITQCAAEPRHAFDVMAGATFELLQSCVAHKIKKLVAASSASIYGLAPEFPTTEAAAPYADRTLYGGLKLLNESLLRSYNDMFGLPCVALRYFNVYGTRMDIHGRYTEVLIRWMERIDGGLPPLIFGDGLQTMDFVEVRDVARANVLAALSPGRGRLGLQRGGRPRSLAQGARGSAAAHHGPPGPRSRASAAARRQPRRAPPRRDRKGRAAASASRPRSGSMRACASSCAGGAPSATPGSGAPHDPDQQAFRRAQRKPRPRPRWCGRAGSPRGRRWRPSKPSSRPSSGRRTPVRCRTAPRHCIWRC